MKNNRLVYLLIIMLAVWLGFVSREAFSRKSNDSENVISQINVTGFSTDLTKVVKEADPSIVTINADGNISSGFVYAQNNDDAYILTAYHSVSAANNINVSFASSYTQKGELIGSDSYIDLAVIKINTPYEMKKLQPGDASILNKGEFVICIGTPSSMDYAGSVELGMISLKHLVVENAVITNDDRLSYYLDLIELSSFLQNGYSGSPVINMNGEFVGMVTMNITNNSVFAITANELHTVADKIISNEEIVRNNLGIKGTFISDMYNFEKSNLNIPIDTLSGIYTSRIREGSLAYEAGIRSGDIVFSINGRDIHGLNEYVDALYFDENDDITFEFLHNSERMIAGVRRD